MEKILITNGKVITADGIIDHGYVLISDGAITAIGSGILQDVDALKIDAAGNYISPGFIDLHVHGGGGADFMDGTVAAFLTVAETHAKYGTTAMCPTTLTSEIEDLLDTLDLYKIADQKNDKGAQFIGMHLEGPYFNVNQRGAQDERYIRNPDPEEYEKILDHSDQIVRWSAAPELPGALEFGKRIKEKGILLALAHTDAVYDEVVKGHEVGYNLATHFYSAMSGVTRKHAFRYAGVIESCYLIDDMDVEIIADGIHLPAPLLKLVYKFKGTDRTALITDAMRAAGMPPGESVLGNLNTGMKVIVEDGVAKLLDRSSFAGSVATADHLVRTMINEGGVPLMDTIKMISSTPARILGIDHQKGTIALGKDADIVVFDEDIQIKLTIVGGRIVYQNP
ncbi:MAG: N-acetylglucosamine-6-phosphate deacetylase [Pedobacter sp.]|nr:N-acetylglucosamine-6-phosphate deacetylase [Pedobacter sp.]